MSQVKNGDMVKVHYTCRLENGKVFESSRNRQPLEVTIGTASAIPAFGKAIMGMEIGEKKTVTIPPEEAYGQRRKELILDVKKSKFPENITPAIGQQLKILLNGHPVNITVVDIKDNIVTLDANHPLAGETLIFDVELIEIA